MPVQNLKAVLLMGAVVSLSACSSYSGPRFVPRPDVPPGQYSWQDYREDRGDRRAYNEYEHREQCQHYRRIPRHSVELANCMVARAPQERVAARETAVTETRMGPIFHSYTVYFDFDKSNIRANQRSVLDQVAREIETYHPGTITVTGYADRSGKASYNEKLSKKRAHTVSEALRGRGIVNEEIDQDARGETDNAVPTPDGVKLQQNRRVTIDFHR